MFDIFFCTGSWFPHLILLVNNNLSFRYNAQLRTCLMEHKDFFRIGI